VSLRRLEKGLRSPGEKGRRFLLLLGSNVRIGGGAFALRIGSAFSFYYYI